MYMYMYLHNSATFSSQARSNEMSNHVMDKVKLEFIIIMQLTLFPLHLL